ncbi:MAG: class I SAM-dependent methyltransferase [Candidatus Lokiarchaeota archaeon]|nr:class I SAM-dependent methyltransferase [Candidatus Lokiarchaeota archaeon]
MYDEFAEDFSNKRWKPWDAFVNFVQTIKNTDLVQRSINKGICCDLGTGNGRHLPVLTEFWNKYIGTDISYQLLRIARDRKDVHKIHNWVACDVNLLPFRDKSLQIIVSVAVFHHILYKYQLRNVMRKITKIIAPDGIMILSLWGAYKGKNENVLKRTNYHRRISHKTIVDSCSAHERFQLGENNVLVPWTVITKSNRIERKPRIYHLYSFNELKIFEEFFHVIQLNVQNMGKNAGINYFLLMSLK